MSGPGNGTLAAETIFGGNKPRRNHAWQRDGEAKTAPNKIILEIYADEGKTELRLKP
jgi:hypothetical protein